MGYDYHITRADDWADNSGSEITANEWLAVVDNDPELSLSGVNGPFFADWRDSWFDLVEGNVTTKNPDTPTLTKMLSLATHFDARVQGDDGDIYDGTGSPDASIAPSVLIASLRFFGIYLLAVLGLSLISTFICYLFGMFDG
jgi:hypothetical protein